MVTKAKLKAMAHARKESVLKAIDEREKATARRQSQVKVMSEWQTIERVLNGCSLSRYGDGEVKHMEGKRNVSQVFNERLQAALWETYRSRLNNHLVAIPNVFNGRSFGDGMSDNYIRNMRRRFYKISDRGYTYGSAYISRGDCCGYLAWSSYWSVISELWRGRDVVVVCGVQRRANPVNMMSGARSLQYVMTEPHGAWKHYDEIVSQCMAADSRSIYLLCVGPTATVLACDLAKRGRWAVDIGHLGLFYKRWGVEYDPDPQVWHHRPSDPGYVPGNEY
jgi:hypothetical protein